jgi:IS30 family transposase
MNLSKNKPGRRNKRTACKLDRQKVLDLHRRGFSNSEIAKQQAVVPSTIWRFLQQTKPERRALESFKAHRADILAQIQAKSLDLQGRILDSIGDGVIEAMKPHQKSGMIFALNAQHGTSFDKERLERGQSTSNHSIISRLLDETVKNLYRKPKPPGREEDTAEPAAE